MRGIVTTAALAALAVAGPAAQYPLPVVHPAVPHIVGHPAKTTTKRTAALRFTESTKTAGFEFRLNHQPTHIYYGQGRRNVYLVTYSNLSPGRYTFSVRATQGRQTSAWTTYSWTVKRVASASHACRGGFDIQGKPSVTNNTFREIRERGSNCQQARGVTQHWIVEADFQETGMWPAHQRVGSFSCTMRNLVYPHGNPYGAIYCTAPGRAISFIGAG